MEKKLSFILQSKGGVGKSAFTFMLANKVSQDEELSKQTLFVDMDNETHTSESQLKFVNIKTHNLINERTKHIDRSNIDVFLENFIDQKKYVSAVCDMGATTSEQFLKFMEDESASEMMEVLHSEGIKVNMFCLVGGDNTFPASSKYCMDLFSLVNGNVSKHIVLNDMFDYTDNQQNSIKKLAKVTKAKVSNFNIIQSEEERSLKEILYCMENGLSPFTDAGRFTLIRFRNSLKKIKVEF